jgi:hypothetical protein
MSFILAEDQALKTLMQGIVVSDEKNNTRSVQAWFSNPDVELRNQSYPYVTIELIGVEWASYRQTSGFIVDNDRQGTVAPSNGEAFDYEVPAAWDLMYQITSYARHPRHDRAIISHLLNNDFVANRGFLPVPNELGTETSYRHIILENFAKRDTVEDGRRLFRNVFTVLVTSESTPTSGDSVAWVEEVLINENPTNIPSGLTEV